jgi:hypothetical protein
MFRYPVRIAVASACVVLAAQEAAAQSVTRGPYLQLTTQDGTVVRWRTDVSTNSRVRYGPAPGQLDETVVDPASVQNHEIALAGLEPDTVYYYAVGTTTQDLAGGTADFRFRTAPEPGARRAFRAWVIGDSGTANDGAEAVRDAYYGYTTGVETDLWLMLGDNAYNQGTDGEYQAAVFDMYPTTLRRTAVWPTMGNHDEANSVDQTGPYYSIFTLPGAAEAGGLASGTESYYSFDFANVHFICLNSEDGDRTPPSDMLTWLETDLAETAQDWVVAYWHHPPYSKGSHDSDSTSDSSGRLVQMRENVLPILEDWGVDLVLCGHSHVYERSFLLDGHYGFSSSLLPSMLLDDGDGRVNGDGAYQKATQGPAGHEGAAYVVAGSSGQVDGGSLDHPAMYYSEGVLGSVVLDFEGDRLDCTFIDDDAGVRDSYTIVKNTGTPPVAGFAAVPASGPPPLAVTFEDLSTTNAATWAWDLDGNGSTDSTEREPSRVYTEPGPHDVGLRVGNASGQDLALMPGAVCVFGDAPPPAGTVVFDPDGATLSWPADPQVPAYDVVRGDLGALHEADGDFAVAVTECLAEALMASPPEVTDQDEPDAGDVWFYLVASRGPCGEPGTYDAAGPSQAAPRDASIAASPNACGA